jgi:Flp pilus assembly protein TadD
MKIKVALLLMLIFCMTVFGSRFASAEDALPLAVRQLIKDRNAAAIESEAKRLDEAGSKFLASLAYGEVCLMRGDLKQAEIYFRKSMEYNPTGMEGKIGMAKTHAAGQETEKAIQLLNDSLKTSPHPVRLHYEKGLILEAAGDPRGAARAFEQGLERYFSKR